MRSMKVAAALVAVFCIYGCADTRLYSEKRDKQGAEASATWKSIDLNAYIVAERANLDALLKAELEAQAAATTLARDLDLEGAILSTETFVATVVKSLDEMISATGATDAYIKRIDELPPLRRAVEEQRKFGLLAYARIGKSPPPACADVTKKKEKPGATPSSTSGTSAELQAASDTTAGLSWTPTFIVDYEKGAPDSRYLNSAMRQVRNLQKACVALNEAMPEAGGQIQLAVEQAERFVAEKEKLVDEKDRLELAYSASSTAYQTFQASITATSVTTSLKLEELGEKLKKSVADLGGSTNPYVIEYLSEKRVRQIESFADVVVQSTPPSSSVTMTSKLGDDAILLANFIDEAKQSLRDGKKPLMYPLLIQLNYDKLNLEAARKDIAGLDKVIDLSNDIVAAYSKQAFQLKSAAADFKQAGIPSDYSLSKAFKELKPDQLVSLRMGMEKYLDAMDRLENKTKELRYRRVAAQYDRALTYDEISAKQWESLIGTNIEQLANYSGGGIKSSSVASAINAAILFAIGVRATR